MRPSIFNKRWGGRKEYKDDQGKVTKVIEWFGFKLHLIVDVGHEVVLGYEISDTKARRWRDGPIVHRTSSRPTCPPVQIATPIQGGG